MKYRKILIKYNAYFEEAVFHTRVNIKSRISHVKKNKILYFHCIETVTTWNYFFSIFVNMV